ncbi:MAG: 4'-phosphopantetheinyl transferase superfamily protein, partial [Streptosporangiales bacterium]|nr:4'-phosphopantetheinyl transferase superfamily protein [Streptosporangiales bacterium]
RLDGFRLDHDRLGYLAAHGLVRTALSSRDPSTEPSRWHFRAAAQGRPELDCAQHDVALRFNLSHTEGTVACVVTAGADCGIDVEHTPGAADVTLLARGTLTADERAALAAYSGERRRREFFRYWTLKEAYAKARGLGMAMPFQEVGFDLGGDAVRLAAGAADDTGGWHFAQWFTPGDAAVGVAIRGPVELVRHAAPPPMR